ncbi:hypothetical protein B0J13DRAFT_603135 [Dactylonectria estremocensis]|uniref:Uncharacterized protein n=1 Tax=Dactylonectria estremocensis TaxID=1079267 RepID=A0A9P9FAX4_9HYPO|nr:hypothetical protein B0J13DRAFT_603135 [Dactylonectria estremocensis]
MGANDGAKFPRMRRFNTMPTPIIIELGPVEDTASLTSTRTEALKTNRAVAAEPPATSLTATSCCVTAMLGEGGAISCNGDDTDSDTGNTGTGNGTGRITNNGNEDDSDNYVPNDLQSSPSPSPSSSLGTAPLAVANHETASPNTNSRSILKSFQAFLTPVNLVMTCLTMVALVWCIKSYNEANLGNLLNQMEACRQHPNNQFLQSTDLCIKMRQQLDYDSDVSLPITNTPIPNNTEISLLPESTNGNVNQRRNVEQHERPQGDDVISVESVDVMRRDQLMKPSLEMGARNLTLAICWYLLLRNNNIFTPQAFRLSFQLLVLVGFWKIIETRFPCFIGVVEPLLNFVDGNTDELFCFDSTRCFATSLNGAGRLGAGIIVWCTACFLVLCACRFTIWFAVWLYNGVGYWVD